MSRDFKVGGK